MVLFPIALVWLGLVVFWAVRRHAADDPSGESPPRWWSKRPRLPRGGPHGSGPRRAEERRRRERSA